MLKFLVKSLAAGALVLAGYALWPRQPTLVEFSPRDVAELDVAAWRDATEGRKGAAMWALYRLYEGQYRLPPADAARAAWNTLQAIEVFSVAADRADQERALPFLEKAFETLAASTGMAGDSRVAARLELFEWMMAADARKRGELATVVAEKLALVHGVPAGSVERAAEPLAKGLGLRAQRKWGAAARELEVGLETLQERVSKMDEDR